MKLSLLTVIQSHLVIMWHRLTRSQKLLALLWVVVGILKAAPDSSPSPSYCLDPQVILVSEKQHTYLEGRTFYCNECVPHPTFVMELYYTRVGGWFEATQRVLILRQKGFNDSGAIQFSKKNNKLFTPVEMYIADSPLGNLGQSYEFVPPATFQQAQFLKPIIIE